MFQIARHFLVEFHAALQQALLRLRRYLLSPKNTSFVVPGKKYVVRRSGVLEAVLCARFSAHVTNLQHSINSYSVFEVAAL